ncbi:hypothetical protein APHNP_1700 [Anaplasma phagocytophilum str. ApNP]|uniref:Uncharacterized protein n=1 Tax=Anaplasma phagocytophilum str. ApNP TaxID=1359153 RepID=A0A0F3NFV8_ANAPH|nr:hypothetical protein APHNP_1700 [Anaplasma phagocytophilum str. ApNP]KJZ98061.1 hypothetical protein APHDU1_1269 [Anaplasma phagocytophilum]
MRKYQKIARKIRKYALMMQIEIGSILTQCVYLQSVVNCLQI